MALATNASTAVTQWAALKKLIIDYGQLIVGFVMGGMRKLKRKSLNRQYMVEPLRPQQSFHAGKMSEVILDFAEPLLNTVDDDDELFEEVISFAVICWNASFLPEKEQKKMIRSLVDEMAKSDVLLRLSVQNDIRMLLERKKTFFADDKRMVRDFWIVGEKGSRHLVAMSVSTNDRIGETNEDYSMPASQ